MGQRFSRCFVPEQRPKGLKEMDYVATLAHGVPIKDCSYQTAEIASVQAVEALQAEVARLSAIVSKLERSTVKAPAPDSDDDINFKRVQHIALQIFSGPHKDKDIAPGMDEPGKADCHAYYVGLPNTTNDMAARLQLVREALIVAEMKADPDPQTLKIVSLPEFFFRGPIGAYSLQEVLGDAFQTDSFISQVQALLEGARWKSWLGIFGTLVAYVIAPGEEYRLHNVYNMCICQQGGFQSEAERGRRCHFVLKHWLSEIDFLDDMCPSHGSVVVKDKFDWLMNHQQHYLDGLRSFGRLEDDCSFVIGDITVGVEICLDHLAKRLIREEPTRKFFKNRPVQVQVVVSSGMHLSDDAIVVKDMPGGLAFINDGLGTTDGDADSRSDGRVYKAPGQYDVLVPAIVDLMQFLSEDTKTVLPKIFCVDNNPMGSELNDPTLALYPVMNMTAS